VAAQTELTTRTQVPVAGRGAWPATRARRRSVRKHLELVVFIAPALLLYFAFVLLPMGMAAFYGFFDWNGLGPLDDFVGFGNYRRALADPVFRGSVQHNAIIIALSIAIQLPLGLALALLLNRRIRGRGLLRTVIFAPYVLSEVVAAVMWLLILQPGGLADAVLTAAGLGGAVRLWLADPDIVLYTMFVVITWKYLGFAIILFLAGLQGVPRELYEAAALDGASRWQQTRYIALPLLGPTIRIWVFLSIIGSLQLFDLVWIMTLGGPAGASSTMATYIIDHGFRRSQFGYGSAVAMILFAISLVVALLYQRFVLRRDTAGAVTRIAG
jgi:raffinose/stachyose/melibiose transport system permease protein